jgi:hypothetical protein
VAVARLVVTGSAEPLPAATVLALRVDAAAVAVCRPADRALASQHAVARRTSAALFVVDRYPKPTTKRYVRVSSVRLMTYL